MMFMVVINFCLIQFLCVKRGINRPFIISGFVNKLLTVGNGCCIYEAGAALFGNSSHIRTYQLPYTMHDDGNDATG